MNAVVHSRNGHTVTPRRRFPTFYALLGVMILALISAGIQTIRAHRAPETLITYRVSRLNDRGAFLEPVGGAGGTRWIARDSLARAVREGYIVQPCSRGHVTRCINHRASGIR